MRASIPCLLALAWATTGCGGCSPTKAPPGAERAVVQDFETSPRIKKWPKDGPGEAVIATDWKASGERSLRIDPGVMASFSELAVADWTPFSLLRIHVHNAGRETQELGLELQDQHDDFAERFQSSFGVVPGDQTLELDIAGGLWRGEQNRPYRGAIKAPLDISHLTRVAFTNRGPEPIFVDRLELETRAPLRAEGGFAFDFGPTGTLVMSETTPVFDTTLYTSERGFGLLGPPADPLARSLSYPSALLGDGLDLARGFRVDLPGGDYLGWIAFERGGFWEGESTGYRRARLVVNGETAHEHEFRANGPAFFFEDTELTTLDAIEEQLVRPAAAVSRFSFKALAGGNTFTLDVHHRAGAPLRVAGLFLAPDTPAGRAFLDAQDARQSKAIHDSFVPRDPSRRDKGKGRGAPERDLVVEPLPPGAEVFPRDYPHNPGGARFFPVAAAHRQKVAFHLGVYAKKKLAIHVEAESLEGPAPAPRIAPRVSYGRYLPMRGSLPGPVWLAVNHYRPGTSFEVGPELARSLLVEYEMPDTGRGVFRSVIKIAGAEAPIELPIELRLVDVDLPEIPIPVGLFMNALPFRPGHVGEKAWWALQEDLLREQGRAGLNCLTGGPGLDHPYPPSGGAEAKSAAHAYIEIARKYATIRAVVPYGGFFATLKNLTLPPAELAAWIGALDPPHYLNAYDEPSTADELRKARDRTAPFTEAGVKTMGFFAGLHGDPSPAPLLDVTFAPAVNRHTRADLDAFTARGKQLFVYNNGMDRYALGVHLSRNIRLGAAGRLEWIGLFTQGFAFDNLDGREPSPSAFLVHDKLGILETPRWLAAREGLTDLRVRLALEARVPVSDPLLASWPLEGYGTDHGRFPEPVLDAQRRAMLERLAERP
jgi:hypothetical protein